MNLLVFDIETVPDTDSARKLQDMEGLSDVEVAESMFAQRRQQTGGSDFIRHHLQKIVAISVVLRTSDNLSVWSLGETDSSEADIIQRFFEGIDRYSPRLVSWNGSGFDLPVLHYRTLLHGINAARYWETGGDDKNFKWNNYISRFHDRHTDLMDVIAGYNPRANAPLTEIATMLGFPGKMGMDGSKVWDNYLSGNIEGIRNYCETDVLNTYLVYPRYELMRGQKSATAYEAECERVRDMLQEEGHPHLLEFASAWK